MSRRDDILTQLNEVPPLPASVLQVIDLLNDPDAATQDLVRAIELDPGLTGNLLRLANSAYYRGATAIGSVRDAFVRLGVKRTFQLVMTTAITPLARQPIRGYDLPPGTLLRHSIATAIGSEQVAREARHRANDHTFTAGLLHDLGKIVMGTYLDINVEEISRLAVQEELSFHEAEQQVLGIDHAEVAAVLLEAWNLPPDIVQVVRWHHDPDASPETSPSLDLVHVANLLVLMGSIGPGRDGLHYRPSTAVVARLGATPIICERALSATLDAARELNQLVSDQIGG